MYYRSSNKGWIWGLIVGIIAAVAIFCIVVGIAAAVNKVGFGQQIVDWFGKSAETVKDVTEVVPKA